MNYFRTKTLACGLAILSSGAAFPHPTPMDDLLRPEIKVTSRLPLTVIVTIRPRENLTSATVETPNNLSGPMVQCDFGALVADQTYRCDVTGTVATYEPVFAINVTGVMVEPDGHRHLSNRALAISNPAFDSGEFRARQADAAKRASAKAVRVKPQ
jgi:hypothetical protein